ncbi:MAG: protein kinase [Anaerolineae bacterium]|nr:protein kinase [Anaerolineae bacterium]
MNSRVLNQRYRLVELIGTGGMATVYRGMDLLLQRPVAVKFLRDPYSSDPEFHKRFLAEAQAAAKLDHTNIVHIYDVGEDEQGRPYIVMEYIEGQELKELIRQSGPLPVNQALVIARQICAGVGHAHRAGIVHCDLKPQNILVSDEGVVKVADFGIARALHHDSDQTDAEPSDIVWGSPHYLAPELATGQPPLPASDVYSIGVMLYEMLTGVPPFHDADPHRLALMHVEEQPVPVTALNPRIPPNVEKIVTKLLEKEPVNRFRNADQVGLTIEEYIQVGKQETQPTPVVTANASQPQSSSPSQPSTQGAKDDGRSIPAAQVSDGVDFMLWALIAVAAIAVLGLVPLWLFVYRSFTAPPVTSTPPVTAVVTPISGTPGLMASVPNLVGLNAADAQRMAESLKFDLVVLGEEETAEARPGAILKQTPIPGARVSEGSRINVVVAAGRTFNLPNVLGYQLDVVQDGLEGEGLIVIVDEVRSTETMGVILQQVPAGGVDIRAGETLTLTVSGGSDVPIVLQVNLNHQVILEHARVSQFGYRPGDSIPVLLRWRCLARFDRSYQVFVHLVTPGDHLLITQQDIEPSNGLRPTTSWNPGEIINDPHQLIIPKGTAPGSYQIRVGLYDGGGRLPVVDPGHAGVDNDSIFISTIEIVE